MQLNVHSITASYSGEIGNAIRQGEKCVILRLLHCNLSCTYCDAKEAARGENVHTVFKEMKDLVTQVTNRMDEHNTNNLLITGGEPLLQQTDLSDFVVELERIREGIKDKYNIQIETNGTICPIGYWPNTQFVFDVKCPSSFSREEENRVSSPDMHYLKVQVRAANSLNCILNRNPQTIYKYVVMDGDDIEFVIWHTGLLRKFISAYYAINIAISFVQNNRQSIFSDRNDKVYAALEKIKNRIDKRFNMMVNVQIHKCLNLP